ncbi:MAG: hypothetical protein ACOC1F_14235, partial [Myxococcota bacterium]
MGSSSQPRSKWVPVLTLILWAAIFAPTIYGLNAAFDTFVMEPAADARCREAGLTYVGMEREHRSYVGSRCIR